MSIDHEHLHRVPKLSSFRADALNPLSGNHQSEETNGCGFGRSGPDLDGHGAVRVQGRLRRLTARGRPRREIVGRLDRVVDLMAQQEPAETDRQCALSVDRIHGRGQSGSRRSGEGIGSLGVFHEVG